MIPIEETRERARHRRYDLLEELFDMAINAAANRGESECIVKIEYSPLDKYTCNGRSFDTKAVEEVIEKYRKEGYTITETRPNIRISW